MEIQIDYFARINQAKHLFLRSLTPLSIAELELIVEEAIVNEAMRGSIESTSLPVELSFLLNDAAPIESVEGCLSFRLYWKRIAAFLVTEECVGGCGQYDDEVYEGKRFRLYSKSHGHLGELIHYKIVCEHQLIDIVSDALPEIEIISRR
jgi:hypothetical protein